MPCLGSCRIVRECATDQAHALAKGNGVALNGVSLNGTALNGAPLNGLNGHAAGARAKKGAAQVLAL